MSKRDIEQADLSPDDLKQAAVAGVRWSSLARIASEVVSLSSAVALARLIAPAEFGAAVVPLIMVPLAVTLTFEGFGSALIQRDSIKQSHIEAAMLASLITGVLLSAITFLLADPVGAPIFGEETADLLRLVSPVFAVACVGVVSRGLLERRLDFRRLNLIEIISLALGSMSAVGMAVAGLGGEAIVLGAMITTLAATLLLLISVPPPVPRWHHVPLREVLSFGLPASAAGLTSVAISNATLPVAAARLAAAQVGLYWRAFQIGIVYQGKISGVMMQLAFPIYARTSDINELRRFHERATRIHAATLVPLLSLLIVLAPDVVPWVFGERWAPAVGTVQILAVAGMIAAILVGYPQILLATGRPQVLFIFNLSLLTLYLVASWIATPYGVTVLALTVVGIHVVMLMAVYGVLFKRLLGIPVGRMISDLLPAAASSLALLIATVPLAPVLRSAGIPVPLIALVIGAVGTAVYASVLRSLFPAIWNDVVLLIVRVMPDRPWALRFHQIAARGAGPA